MYRGTLSAGHGSKASRAGTRSAAPTWRTPVSTRPREQARLQEELDRHCEGQAHDEAFPCEAGHEANAAPAGPSRLTSEAKPLMLKGVSGTERSGSSYWDGISDQIAGHYYHDETIGRLKRDVHLRLIARWCPDLRGKRLLKTDLFEEAHGADQFLFDLPAGGLRAGIDISPVIARRARAQAAGDAPRPLLAADVLALPFRAGAFDVIVSNSTLDHFSDPRGITEALTELHRVLKPGGTLVVTLDNPWSLSYLAGRLKRRLRPDPYFLGHTLSRGALTATLTALGFRVTDTTAIIHGLENHSSAAMRVAWRIGGRRLHAVIRTILVLLEHLEATPTRYLTGAFVAARAVKE
jgi:SAM-dependent methyltransferase